MHGTVTSVLRAKRFCQTDRGRVMGKVDEFLDEVMTSNDVSEYLKMHPKTVAKLAKAGKLPGAKFGGEWRFRRSVLDSYLDSREKSKGEQS